MGWYLTITEEMRDAGLAGNLLLVYALINGYSQKQRGCYYGSLANTSEVIGCTDETVRTSLKTLTERGFIERFEFMDGGVHRVAYRTLPKNLGTQKIPCDLPKNLGGTSQKIWDNNNTDIENENKEKVSISAPARGKFDFRQALLDLGVTAETADAWMEVRRRAKAVNSELAFKDVAAQIAKSGHTAEECIHRAAAKSWRGFEAAWMEDRQTAQTRQQPRKQENYFEANARVAEQIRRDLFKEAQPYDEQ